MLFSDTLRNNLAYGDPTADTDRVVAAARDAQALDFIANLPEGFETVVGERGVGLSGGQRQRVTIARALLTEAPVLILDDATASVDTQTERRIQKALQVRAQRCTTFVISQRVSSVQHADQILVIEDGCVTDRGTHDELAARSSFYRGLVERQRQAGGHSEAGNPLVPGPRVPARRGAMAVSGSNARGTFAEEVAQPEGLDTGVAKRLLGLLAADRRRVGIALTALLAVAAFGVAQPVIIGKALDDGVQANDGTVLLFAVIAYAAVTLGTVSPSACNG